MTCQQTRRKLEEEEKRLKDRLKEIEEEKSKLPADPIYDVAEALHDAFCTANHTDGCEWGYTSWTNYGKYSARETYLKKAEALMKVLGVNQHELALRVIKVLGRHNY